MKVIEAKEQVLQLIQDDVGELGVEVDLDPGPTPNDPGKFYLKERRARVIQPYDGFHANINLDWFEGSTDLPEINREAFYWYVFALREGQSESISTYYICDYLRIREWVLDFDAPEGNDHRDHHDWRGEIQILGGRSGYFRWGDEPLNEERPGRHIQLRNIEEVAEGIPEKETMFAESDGSSSGGGGNTAQSFSSGQAKDIGELGGSANRTEITTARVVRDTKMARRIKEHHDHLCQLCGDTVDLRNGKRYAEAHHIRPLGRPHDGPDRPENILCLCPTCHVRLDYGDRRLAPDDLQITSHHEVGHRFLAYHNREIFEE